MQQAGYYYTNALALRVAQDIEGKIQEQDQHILVMLQSILSLVELNPSSNFSLDSDPYPAQVASSITSDQTQLVIL